VPSAQDPDPVVVVSYTVHPGESDFLATSQQDFPLAADGSWSADIEIDAVNMVPIDASCRRDRQSFQGFAEYVPVTVAALTRGEGYMLASTNTALSENGDALGDRLGRNDLTAPIVGVAAWPG